MTAGIYCLTNKINGKKYVGQSMDIKDRLSKGYNGGVLFNAIKEFGKENFELEILYELGKIDKDWRETLWIHEEYFIHKFDTTNPEKGYNVQTGGPGSKGMNGKTHHFFGKSHTEEAKKKMRETKKQKAKQRHKELCERLGLKAPPPA